MMRTDEGSALKSFGRLTQSRRPSTRPLPLSRTRTKAEVCKLCIGALYQLVQFESRGLGRCCTELLQLATRVSSIWNIIGIASDDTALLVSRGPRHCGKVMPRSSLPRKTSSTRLASESIQPRNPSLAAKLCIGPADSNGNTRTLPLLRLRPEVAIGSRSQWAPNFSSASTMRLVGGAIPVL
jgi:hypothetical protein